MELKVVWRSWIKGGGGEDEKRPQRQEGAKSQKALHAKLMKLNLTLKLGGIAGGFEVMEKQTPDGLG